MGILLDIVIALLVVAGIGCFVGKKYIRCFILLFIAPVVVIGVYAFCFGGNSRSIVEEGELVGLRYLEADTDSSNSVSFIPVAGKFFPISRISSINYPEAWAVDVVGEDGIESTYYVDEGTFSSLKIGDSIRYDENVMSTERPKD